MKEQISVFPASAAIMYLAYGNQNRVRVPLAKSFSSFPLHEDKFPAFPMLERNTFSCQQSDVRVENDKLEVLDSTKSLGLLFGW